MSDTNAAPAPAESTTERTTERKGLSTAERRKARSKRPRHSKRYQSIAKALPADKVYLPDEVFVKLKEIATAKFDETVEGVFNLGVDPRHGDQMVRGATALPHGTGKSQKVWVFARGENAEAATNAGADLVGAEDLAERIQKAGGADCDILVASPDMMQLVGRLGQILKQKMPNPKAGTVSPNVGKVVADIKAATRAEYRVEKAGIVHVPLGKASYPAEHLQANFAAMLSALVKAKPQASKGKYLKKVTVSTTMSPPLEVDVASAEKLSAKGAS